MEGGAGRFPLVALIMVARAAMEDRGLGATPGLTAGLVLLTGAGCNMIKNHKMKKKTLRHGAS